MAEPCLPIASGDIHGGLSVSLGCTAGELCLGMERTKEPGCLPPRAMLQALLAWPFCFIYWSKAAAFVLTSKILPGVLPVLP